MSIYIREADIQLIKKKQNYILHLDVSHIYKLVRDIAPLVDGVKKLTFFT